MYIETHKKRDGSFVTDEARDIAVSCTFWSILVQSVTSKSAKP